MKQTLSSRKRILWIDWAKAIGISLVVWGHFSPIARHEIFLFHMPFFFMISGLLYRQKGLMNELKGSVFSLVLPYLIYNFLYMSPLPFGGQGILRLSSMCCWEIKNSFVM